MIKKINHIAIAVPDLRTAADFYERQLKLELTGQETIASNKVKVGFLRVGDSSIELVQPDSDDSPVAKFLRTHGPGIHHLCLEVDDIDAEFTRLQAAGVRFTSTSPLAGAHGCRVAFIHPDTTGGVLLELSQTPPASHNCGTSQESLLTA